MTEVGPFQKSQGILYVFQARIHLTIYEIQASNSNSNVKFKIVFILFVCQGLVYVSWHLCVQKVTFRSGFSLYPRQGLGISSGSKYLYPLSHSSGSEISNLKKASILTQRNRSDLLTLLMHLSDTCTQEWQENTVFVFVIKLCFYKNGKSCMCSS